MDNKTCELVQTLMNANEKLEKEVKFLRNRKSELDRELKRYIECNDNLHRKIEQHDKKLNEKYWEGYGNGQKDGFVQTVESAIFDAQNEAYLKGYKEGTAAVFEIWDRVRAK